MLRLRLLILITAVLAVAAADSLLEHRTATAVASKQRRKATDEERLLSKRDENTGKEPETELQELDKRRAHFSRRRSNHRGLATGTQRDVHDHEDNNNNEDLDLQSRDYPNIFGGYPPTKRTVAHEKPISHVLKSRDYLDLFGGYPSVRRTAERDKPESHVLQSRDYPMLFGGFPSIVRRDLQHDFDDSGYLVSDFDDYDNRVQRPEFNYHHSRDYTNLFGYPSLAKKEAEGEKEINLDSRDYPILFNFPSLKRTVRQQTETKDRKGTTMVKAEVSTKMLSTAEKASATAVEKRLAAADEINQNSESVANLVAALAKRQQKQVEKKGSSEITKGTIKERDFAEAELNGTNKGMKNTKRTIEEKIERSDRDFIDIITGGAYGNNPYSHEPYSGGNNPYGSYNDPYGYPFQF